MPDHLISVTYRGIRSKPLEQLSFLWIQLPFDDFLNRMQSPSPIRVEPQSNQTILLGWNNRETYTVPYLELRYHCPCASCVDEHTGKRTLKRETLNPEVRPISVTPVGRYALQIGFSDKHSTGIYAFDTLYKICKEAGTLTASG